MGALDSVHRRKLSLEEFHRLGAVGILSEDDRIELIDGEMIEMAPIGAPHALMVSRLSRMLNLAVGQDSIVWTQNPIALPSHSEPQPDLALLRPPEDRYRHSLPSAADVLLVVEVADTTLSYDRDVKVPLYARHGISEVWLFDLQGSSLYVYREPRQEQFQQTVTISSNGVVTPILLPNIKINLTEVWR